MCVVYIFTKIKGGILLLDSQIEDCQQIVTFGVTRQADTNATKKIPNCHLCTGNGYSEALTKTGVSQTGITFIQQRNDQLRCLALAPNTTSRAYRSRNNNNKWSKFDFHHQVVFSSAFGVAWWHPKWVWETLIWAFSSNVAGSWY